MFVGDKMKNSYIYPDPEVRDDDYPLFGVVKPNEHIIKYRSIQEISDLNYYFKAFIDTKQGTAP